MDDIGTASPALSALVGLDDALAAMAAGAARHDQDSSFPHEAFAALHRTGALRLTIPRSAGGLGGTLADAASLVQTVSTADASVGLVLSQHLQQHAALAVGSWPDAVRAEVQRTAVDDGALINALRVEPALGTPARGGLPATVAVEQPDGSGWLVSGHKIYATGIPALRWLAVYARTGAAEPQVGTFLVDARSPGWRIVETWDHLGMRATASHDVVLEGVAVPAERAMDLSPAGAAVLDLRIGVWNSLLIASVYQGAAVAALRWLSGYLHDRVPANLGKPLASLERFQLAVGTIEAKLRTSQRLLDSATAQLDTAGLAEVTEASVVKLAVTTNAIEAVDSAVSLIGNPALSRSNPLERHYRDVLCGRIHTPQDDAVFTMLGRSTLGAAAPTRP